MGHSHLFHLTNKQADSLTAFIELFYKRALESQAVPYPMKLLLNGVRQAIREQAPLEQFHIDVILWALELFFAQFSEEDMDIQLEMCYHKLAGYWYEGFDAPWYERIKKYDRNGVYQKTKGEK